MAVTNSTSYNGSKLGLSTDKINKWLREALYNKHALPRGTRLLTGTTLAWSWLSLHLQTSGSTWNPPSDRWVHLKHKLSKREYKGVLSKTYRGAILLMHMYQGKGRWGSTCRSFDLANLNYEYQTLR